MIGTQILNYQIKSHLGDGGMGTVYLAEHTKLDRKVAIKILHPHLASNESIRHRFINEAKTMSGLQHPNIVGLLDYHEDQFGLYLIMEYVEGITIDKYIANVTGPIPEEKAKKIFKQALDGFQYAHEKSIVHRDIKPSNLIITNDEKVKILDFGIAKLLGNESYKLTKTGGHTGTVYYMSPEQVRGLDVDFKSDIYSLGITLYQMLTGYNPYCDLTTEYEIFEKIVKTPLADPRIIYPAVSEHMCKVIAKATQKNPGDRFVSCDEFSSGIYNENSFSVNITKSDSAGMDNYPNANTEIRHPFPQNKNANKNLPIIILSAFLFVASAGFFGYKYFSNKTDNENTKPQSEVAIEKNQQSNEVDKEADKKEASNDKVVPVKKDSVSKTNVNVPPVQDPNAPIKFFVKARTLNDLRTLIKSKSNFYMKNKGYTPINPVFSPGRLTFSCELVPQPSNFTLITLVFAPVGGVCESCINALNKNVGSMVLVDVSDASLQYNVISIAE